MIFIKLGSDAKEARWGIIELQGDLISQNDLDLHGQFIGDLHYTKQGIPMLIIGHHILTGKEVTLEKPFAVLQRQRLDHDGNQCSQGNSDHAQTEYIVQAIVKKKLIFKAECVCHQSSCHRHRITVTVPINDRRDGQNLWVKVPSEFSMFEPDSTYAM